MSDGVVTEAFEFRLTQPPAALWPLLADTNRLNHALEMPRFAITLEREGEALQRVGKTIGAFSGAGRQTRWRETPYEWVAGQWWRFERRYYDGPLSRLSATLYLRKSAGGGALGQYALTAEPSGVVGATLLSSGHLRRLGELFVDRAEAIDAFLSGKSPTPFEPVSDPLDADARYVLEAGLSRLTRSAYGHGVAPALAAFLTHAPEPELADMRVRRMARMLDLSERDAAEACLAAAEAGLLTRRFIAHCPRCRRPVVEADSLSALPERASCGHDGVDFAVDLAVNVETLFAPNLAIRPIGDGAYCVSGPMTAPHVVIQQRLEPGERRAFPYVARPGGYRVRIENAEGRITAAAAGMDAAPAAGAADAAERVEVALDYDGGAFPVVAAAADGPAIGGEPPEGAVVFENHTSQPRLIRLERREWRADALTAAEIAPLQAFRELFPHDAPSRPLRAGRLVFVGFALLDREGLYLINGDRDALERLEMLVAAAADKARRRNGGLIRSQGERGLAAFLDPVDAVRFAQDMRGAAREWLAAPEGVDDGETAAAAPRIGLGVSAGRAHAQRRGGGFDYAGFAPALAERLAETAAPGEILVAADLARLQAVIGALGPGARREDRVEIAGWREKLDIIRAA